MNITKFVPLLQGDSSSCYIQCGFIWVRPLFVCPFFYLSSWSSLLVYKYIITRWISLAFGMYWQQYKKMCLSCTNQCVLFLSLLSIFGHHLLGNMTPKLNRGCVTFIERFVHSFIFWLMSHEPMSLFSVACLTNSSSHTSLKLTKTGLSETSLGPANFP